MQKIEIAKVLKPQGIKGEIKVECFISDFDFLKNLDKFFIDEKEFNITSIRFDKKYAFIGTKEINDRNEAENFRNKIILAYKPEIKNENEFYISDLENCQVVDESNNIIGFVDYIEDYGATHIINILHNGARSSFPFLKQVIKTVDIENKKIVVFKDKLEEVIV